MSAHEKLDNAEVLVEIKGLEKSIVEKFEAIEKTTERANGELKELGQVSQETKGKLEEITKQYDELYERLQVVEQKGASMAEEKEVSVGKQFIESTAFKDMMEGRTSRARMEFKTAIINATGQNQPLVPSDRDTSGIYHLPNRNLRIRDILPSSPTSSNLIEFTRENTFTNNAGPQIGGSPEAYENVTKPRSDRWNR